MAQMRIGAPLVVMALLILVAPSSGAQTRELNLGGLIVSLSDSRTAQVFHIVDQLSLWDKGTHGGYARWAARNLLLNEADRKLLLQHAELRRARGWSHGFEQAFYVDDSIEVAAQRAVAANLISSNEAATEKMILLHFAPILSGLLDRSVPKIAAFRTRIATEGKKITPVVKKLIRFSETKGTLRVPLFLVSNPEEGSGGGGFNGGQLVVEIQEQPDPLPILFHECLHALLWQHKEAIRVAAESIGVSWVTLNEGIAHAFSPGLTDNPRESDSLADGLAGNLLRGTATSDSSVQLYVVAFLIRPLLRSALARGETFSSFLPKAVSRLKKFSWRSN